VYKFDINRALNGLKCKGASQRRLARIFNENFTQGKKAYFYLTLMTY